MKMHPVCSFCILSTWSFISTYLVLIWIKVVEVMVAIEVFVIRIRCMLRCDVVRRRMRLFPFAAGRQRQRQQTPIAIFFVCCHCDRISMSSYSNGSGIKREFSRDDGEGDGREERKRKRKSRWGNSDTDRVIIPGLPTVLPSNITPEQEKTYLCEYHVFVLSNWWTHRCLFYPQYKYRLRRRRSDYDLVIWVSRTTRMKGLPICHLLTASIASHSQFLIQQRSVTHKHIHDVTVVLMTIDLILKFFSKLQIPESVTACHPVHRVIR